MGWLVALHVLADRTNHANIFGSCDIGIHRKELVQFFIEFLIAPEEINQPFDIMLN